MHLLNYIIWNPSQTLFELGFFKVRWYSLMIICAFLGGRVLLSYFFKREGRPVEDVEKFSLYVLIACLVGARLGEVLFYDPMYYLKNPLEAILPIELHPTFKVVGYRGLSYHGALIGGFIGALLYANYRIRFSLHPFRFKLTKHQQPGQSFFWLLTPLAFGVMMGFFVRIGNFINSEIRGIPTNSKYGVIFAAPIVNGITHHTPAIQQTRLLKDTTSARCAAEGNYPPVILECTFSGIGTEEADIKQFVDTKLKRYLQHSSAVYEHLYLSPDEAMEYSITRNKKSQYIVRINAFGIPRHPVQLYESFSYLITLTFLFTWWYYRGASIREGVIAGIATMASYSFRFFFEFFKDPFNVVIAGNYPITMGHILSICTVLAGMAILFFACRRPMKDATSIKPAPEATQ
eukprot:gene200-264_t